MNEQLQSKLVEILAGIQSATKAAGDFAFEQLPDIAQQYVAYGRVVETAGFIVSLAFFVASLVVAIRLGYLNKSAVHTNQYQVGDWTDSRLSAVVLGTMLSIVGFCVTCSTASHAAMVWLAPKVWLLKEIAGLIK